MKNRVQYEAQGALTDALSRAGDESCDGELLEAVQRIFDRSPDKSFVLSSLASAVELRKVDSFEISPSITRCVGFLEITSTSLHNERIEILSDLLNHDSALVRHDATQQLDRLHASQVGPVLQIAYERESPSGTKDVMGSVLRRWSA